MTSIIRRFLLSIVAVIPLLVIGLTANGAEDLTTYRAVVTAGPDPSTVLEEFRSTVEGQNLKRLILFNNMLKKNLGPNPIEEYGVGCIDCSQLSLDTEMRQLNYLFYRSAPNLLAKFTKAWTDSRVWIESSATGLRSEDFAVTFNGKQGAVADCGLPKPPPCESAPICIATGKCDDKSPNRPGACDLCVP